MPTPKRSTAHCVHCNLTVDLYYYTNDNDPGDNGMLRVCGHGDFVRTYVTFN